MDIFDWHDFRKRFNQTDLTREGVIRRAFIQWAKGNDMDLENDYSQLEVDNFFNIFKAGYITAESFTAKY